MKNRILFIALSLYSICLFASDAKFAKIFNHKEGCFILYDVNREKTISEYNPNYCKQRVSPNSTFKIPLSLMAFDQKIITQKTIFLWDDRDKGMEEWNHDQTPKTWIENSVVWVSQTITKKMGLEKVKVYLRKFNYGNQDFSGNSNTNEALTHAWLDSSLKISAEEQLAFMKKLISDKLPISQQAMTDTKANLYIQKLMNGYEFFGKTGTGIEDPNNHLQHGWFVGFLSRNNQAYIVIVNFKDTSSPKSSLPAGKRARNMALSMLNVSPIAEKDKNPIKSIIGKISSL